MLAENAAVPLPECDPRVTAEENDHDECHTPDSKTSNGRSVTPFPTDNGSEETSRISEGRPSAYFQNVLQIAACLNIAFSKRSLSVAAGGISSAAISSALDSAVEEQILVLHSPGKKKDVELFKFLSEDVRSRLYLSIPERGRENMHASIGRRLCKSEQDADHQIALDQLRLGERCLRPKERIPLALLCLSVGRKMAQNSDFAAAASYLNFGIQQLSKQSEDPDSYWREEYELSLTLHTAATEANYCASKHDKAEECIQAVLKHARTFLDSISVRATQLYMFGNMGRRTEALELGLEALRQLGEPLTTRPNKCQFLWNYLVVRRQCRRKSNESILRMPIMTDENMLAVMKMLNIVIANAISVRPELFPFLVFRQVRLTLKHGLTVMASIGFAFYGMILCNLEHYEEGHRFATLALSLYEKFPVQQWLPRVYTGVYVGVYGSSRPLETTLDPLLHAHRIGMETGDVEVALMTSYIYSINLFALGHPLGKIEHALLDYHGKCVLHKQDWNKNRYAVFLQFTQNLMGKAGTPNPTILSGETFTECEEMLDILSRDGMSLFIFRFFRMILCYTFGDYQQAVSESLFSKVYRPNIAHVFFKVYLLFETLSALAVAHGSTKGSQWNRFKTARLARRAIDQLQRRASLNPTLVCGKIFLLEAELAWLLNQHDQAQVKYACAIALSAANGLLFDKALSHERAGRYFYACKDKLEATKHLQEAHRAYLDWGATAKADHLKKEMQERLGLPE